METYTDIMEAEMAIQNKYRELARKEYEQYLQRLADSIPAVGYDGRPLVRMRTIGMQVMTSFGTAHLRVKNGQCRGTGRYETPFRERCFGGGRGWG